ncbi:MAG: LysE family translocator [Hyphomicrobium sp.]|nr:LysE family translocator [Hyphomicrobium sp.]
MEWAELDLPSGSVPLAFLWTALIIELTPGPNMTYLAVLSLSEGRKAGFTAVAGVATGLLIVGLLSALGLATLIAQSPQLYQALRWTGVAYLLWLAFELWRGEPDGGKGLAEAQSLRTYFQRGLITNLLNPKAAIFYVAVLPPFIDPNRPILPQTLALSLTYVAVATAVHLGIVAAAAQARPWLSDRGDIQRVRAALALSVVGIALWLAWATLPAAS